MAARPGRDKRLYLIDGMPLVYRAYFVFLNNPLITANGFNSSAVFGYTNSLLQILADEEPTHIAVVFDAPGPTWRTDAYADYKGTRQKAPEGVRDSLPHVQRVTEAMGIPVISHAGVEADDVIGTIARRAEAAGFDTYMVTLDKDFAQLVGEHTFLYRLPRMGGDPPQILDVAGVRERFGVARPEQVIDLIGLAGDSVDNIPGIPGVGEKTAQKLIDRFGSVEALVAATDQLKGKQRDKIETFAAQALLSKRLATIDREVEVAADPDQFATAKLDPERVIPIFQEFEFNALVKRIFGDGAAAAAPGAGAPPRARCVRWPTASTTTSWWRAPPRAPSCATLCLSSSRWPCSRSPVAATPSRVRWRAWRCPGGRDPPPFCRCRRSARPPRRCWPSWRHSGNTPASPRWGTT